MQANRTGQFAAPYDQTTKVVSAVVCVSLLAVAAVIPNVYIAVSLFSVLGAYAYSVRGYAVTEGWIVVRRFAGNVRLPLTQVREARRAEPADFQGCTRLWGSGGLFGSYGLYQTSRLGPCTWYLTNRKNAVVVRTDGKTALYSPDDVDGFLAAVGAPASGVMGSYSETAPASPGIINARTVAGVIACVLGVAGVALAVAAARYSPGPPEYTLTAGSLAIHDKFYPVTLSASSVDTAAIRVVDLTEEPGWRPALRTGGFSNTHYRSGWFRAKNGQRMRLYWANGTRVVLLPSKGETAPVLMEVADPDGFVRDARGEWR